VDDRKSHKGHTQTWLPQHLKELIKTYNKELIKKLSGIEPDIRPPKQLETADDYKEIEDMYNTYLFNKRGNKI
jgi:hypothetical protein